MDYSFATVPVITILVYWILELVKLVSNQNEKIKRFLPVMATGLGIVLGVVIFFAFPTITIAENWLFALVVGGVSGLAATGTNQIFKQISKFGLTNYEKNKSSQPELQPRQKLQPNNSQKPKMPDAPKSNLPLGKNTKKITKK